MKKRMNNFSPHILVSFSILKCFYYKSCKCYDIVIFETDRALFIYFRGLGVIVMVEGVEGGETIIFYLLFWVPNGRGESGKNTANIRGASKN